MKRIQRIATVILSAALIMLNTEPVMAASKIYNIIEHDELTIDEGKKCSLALPTKYKIVKWTSSNSNVAKVSKSGKLTAVNGGYATITAKTKDFNFKCYVTVNENYSEWTVRYSTDDLLDLLDNIADGYVAKINGEYYCSPEYVEMLKNTKTTVIDVSNGDQEPVEHLLTPDAEFTIIDDKEDDSASKEEAIDRINKMEKYGFSSSEEMETEIGKAYMAFCDEWANERELENLYNISVVQSIIDDKLYLIINVDNKYIITGSPQKPESGTIYTNGEVQYQYLEKFEYNNQSYNVKQYFFNREDLIKNGIIK